MTAKADATQTISLPDNHNIIVSEETDPENRESPEIKHEISNRFLVYLLIVLIFMLAGTVGVLGSENDSPTMDMIIESTSESNLSGTHFYLSGHGHLIHGYREEDQIRQVSKEQLRYLEAMMNELTDSYANSGQVRIARNYHDAEGTLLKHAVGSGVLVRNISSSTGYTVLTANHVVRVLPEELTEDDRIHRVQTMVFIGLDENDGKGGYITFPIRDTKLGENVDTVLMVIDQRPSETGKDTGGFIDGVATIEVNPKENQFAAVQPLDIEIGGSVSLGEVLCSFGLDGRVQFWQVISINYSTGTITTQALLPPDLPVGYDLSQQQGFAYLPAVASGSPLFMFDPVSGTFKIVSLHAVGFSTELVPEQPNPYGSGVNYPFSLSVSVPPLRAGNVLPAGPGAVASPQF